MTSSSEHLTKTLMRRVSMQPEDHTSSSKVTVVGVGQVGMASVFSMLTGGVVSEVALVDVNADKLRGEMMDLQHGQAFLRNVKVHASTDYAVTAGSRICVVTAGARQNEGESRLSLVQRNVNIYKSIIPQLIKYSPDTILVIVSNPVDILTYVAWKISGLPQHRVIGSGTMLDSSRFRFLLSERLGISPRSVHAYIIGEHGDSSVAVWSAVNAGGVRLREIYPNMGSDTDTEDWGNVHKDVIQSAYEIIRLKGYTSWAIGLMVSALVTSILGNQHDVFALSVLVRGMHGVDADVYLSLPAVVSQKGITHVFKQPLTEDEITKFQSSAKVMTDLIAGLGV